MKLALATWEPGPPWFRYAFAEPITAPWLSTATTVRPGGSTNHIAIASLLVMCRS